MDAGLRLAARPYSLNAPYRRREPHSTLIEDPLHSASLLPFAEVLDVLTPVIVLDQVARGAGRTTRPSVGIHQMIGMQPNRVGGPPNDQNADQPRQERYSPSTEVS